MTSGAEQAAEAARQAKKNRPPDSKPPKQPSILGGVIAAVFTKETGMARYAKLWGGLSGYVIGAILGVLLTNGFATCVDATVLTAETCTLTAFGFNIPATALSRVIELIGLGIGIYQPTNAK